MKDVESQSVEFLDKHVSKTFSYIFSKELVEEVFWIESEYPRPYATIINSNLIVLFPFFIPK
jgi:hypothetical protein